MPTVTISIEIGDISFRHIDSYRINKRANIETKMIDRECMRNNPNINMMVNFSVFISRVLIYLTINENTKGNKTTNIRAGNFPQLVP